MKIKLRKNVRVRLKGREVYAVFAMIREWKELQPHLIERGVDMGAYAHTLLKMLDKWDNS